MVSLASLCLQATALSEGTLKALMQELNEANVFPVFLQVGYSVKAHNFPNVWHITIWASQSSTTLS
jgi:hypothetical protein